MAATSASVASVGSVATIRADNLSREFRAPVRDPGLRAAFGALLRPTYRAVRAVDSISFEVQPGEVVGFIGPNGAGKTTTLKMLAGILHPSGGSAEVLGFVPWRRDTRYLKQIAMIRGSRPIAAPDAQTAMDAFRFQQIVYDVPEPDFRRNLDELIALLDLDRLLDRQLRALSLGEKMRCGLAHKLLYRPRVLFLDEPTIGMDVTGTAVVRRFIADYARQTGATILLTSHYMADVETLCRRVILIDKGQLRYDGDLAGLAASISPYKLIHIALNTNGNGNGSTARTNGAAPDWSRFGDSVEVAESENGKVALRVRREDVPAVAARLLAELSVSDLSVENPPLESVIDRVYREGVAS